MKLFYIAVTQDGKRVKGFIEATDTAKAAFYLRERSLMPIRIERESAKALGTALNIGKHVSGKDIVFITRQIATMLTSGLTLTQTLGILKNQVQKENMIGLIEGIISHIEEGKSFSDALVQYPDVFSPIYVALIRAGETSGLLDKVMLRLADSLEKSEALKKKIKGALMYPIIVITLMVLVTIAMLIFVIPQLGGLYKSMNLEMPIPTQIVLGLSDFVIHYFFIIFIAAVLVSFYFNKWRKSESGKSVLDKLVLKLPIFGKLIRFSLLTEFARTFGLLVGTGALVIEALHKTSDIVGNDLYRDAIVKVATDVEKGITIGDAMGNNELFPSILVETVKIGEQTGKLDESLMRVSDYFERESETIVQNMTTAMEPFIMVILAIGVGFLIISILTPIYSLLSSFQ